MKTKFLILLILCIALAVLISACGKEDHANKVEKPASEPMFRSEEANVEKGDKSIASLAV